MSKSTVTITPAVDTVVITPVVSTPNVNIEALRIAAVESESTVYGARRNYANGINTLAGGVAWYRDGVALPKAIELEKKEYYKALKAIGYSNPSNAWKMVKQYAFGNALELGLFGEVAPEGGEGELFGLYATTGRAISFITPALFALLVTLGGADYWGILGIVAVLALGLVLMLPLRLKVDR
jgi:hypothetical protein